MLKLLLDEHISPEVARSLRCRDRSLVVRCMAEWEQGSLLGLDDEACLEKAKAQGLTLVTYDRRTIPILLKAWAHEGRSHRGVIFVDEKTISPADVGSLTRSLVQMIRETKDWDWTDRVIFLKKKS